MKAIDIMTPDPLRVDQDTPLGEAVRLMNEHGVRHLVVTRDESLLGVVSDRDLMQASGWLDPCLSDELKLATGTIQEYISRSPLTVAPPEPVANIAALLVEWGIGCVPVLEGGELCGIVTETDVLRAFAAECRYGRLGRHGNPPVTELMTEEVQTLDRCATLGEAQEILRAADFRHLPVTEDDRLLNMVSDRDVRACLGRGAPQSERVCDLLQGDVLTANTNDELSYAVGLMLEQEFSSVPVEESGRLLGIVTTTDVLEHCSRTLS